MLLARVYQGLINGQWSGVCFSSVPSIPEDGEMMMVTSLYSTLQVLRHPSSSSSVNAPLHFLLSRAYFMGHHIPSFLINILLLVTAEMVPQLL